MPNSPKKILLIKFPAFPAIPKLLINRISEKASTPQRTASYFTEAEGDLRPVSVFEERFLAAICFPRFLSASSTRELFVYNKSESIIK